MLRVLFQRRVNIDLMEGKPWHETDAAEFARIAPQLAARYPYLHVTARGRHTVPVGDVPLFLDNRAVDSFAVVILVLPQGPRLAVPIVREVGGRIPRIADRHAYVDGTACLFI